MMTARGYATIAALNNELSDGVLKTRNAHVMDMPLFDMLNDSVTLLTDSVTVKKGLQ